MNKRHNFITRTCFSVAAWCGALAATRSLTLANLLAAEFWHDEFYVALRKSARFARYSPLRLDLFKDPFFNFTLAADKAELDALKKHLEQLKTKISLVDYYTDLLYIQAARIHLMLREESDQEKIETEIQRFYNWADTVLAEVKIAHTPTKNNSTKRAEDFNLDDARRALSDFASSLPNDKWPWYVVSGTFLGLHREGGFLSHDYDIDIGINAEEIDTERLLHELRGSDKFVVSKLDYHYEILSDGTSRQLKEKLSIIKLVHQNGLQVDLFIHYTENGVCWHGSSIHRWENKPFDLVQREFEGVQVLAPADADLYLTENYGDWRTPVKDFDCTTGTPNLVVAKNFISVALFIKRFCYFSSNDCQEALKLLATLKNSGVFLQDVTGQLRLGIKL